MIEAHERVEARAGGFGCAPQDERVRALSAGDPVPAEPADDAVIAAAPEDVVRARAAADRVRAVAAEDAEAAVRLGRAVEGEALVRAERVGGDDERAARRDVAVVGGEIVAVAEPVRSEARIAARQHHDLLDAGDLVRPEHDRTRADIAALEPHLVEAALAVDLVAGPEAAACAKEEAIAGLAASQDLGALPAISEEEAIGLVAPLKVTFSPTRNVLAVTTSRWLAATFASTVVRL
jgi:hypothetical protein